MERVAAEEPPAGDRQVEQRPIELILARQLAAALAVPVLLMDGRGDTLFFNEPAELIIADGGEQLIASLERARAQRKNKRGNSRLKQRP